MGITSPCKAVFTTLGATAFATEQPVLIHSEFRPIDEVERTGGTFEIISEFEPSGGQPQAIAESPEHLDRGEHEAILMGVAGISKSAIVAWLIEEVQRPILVMAPNKILAAQLANELHNLLPNNAVEYLVPYYDYYQLEAYITQVGTYIEKDSSVNEDTERLRHSATSALLSRRDVVVASSVSCIHGLGTLQPYLDRSVWLKEGGEVNRDQFLRLLVDIQYARNDTAFTRGTFRVEGNVVDIIPAYEEKAVRVEFFGDKIDSLYYLNLVTGDVIDQVPELRIFLAARRVTDPERTEHVVADIKAELAERLADLENRGKLPEVQHLRVRTEHSLEVTEQVGFCSGIESYSRHVDGCVPDSAPATLIGYFPEDFPAVVDGPHVIVPQVGGMFRGDASRKRNLVDFGFCLPSALDNHPLTLDEFDARVDQAVFISVTLDNYELEKAGGEYVEQVIRPAGLVDPEIVAKPTEGQVGDLIGEIWKRTERDERVLVTTLTKEMAEDLTGYLLGNGVQVRYMHSDADTLKCAELLRQLCLGEYDVLIDINLLREGLDLPEVPPVAILGADKEGFLCSERSLIQTISRAARNIPGEMHMYVNKVTDFMWFVIDEMERRHGKRIAYNTEHGTDSQPLCKKITDVPGQVYDNADTDCGGKTGVTADTLLSCADGPDAADGASGKQMPRAELEVLIVDLLGQMAMAARELKFEFAGRLRSGIFDLKKELKGMIETGVE